jgi:type I restriction enzyme M protein
MKPVEYQPQGSRVASVHNGSSLFTGDAGSGESNIRRYLIENDLVDAIVQLPNNIFYNTGISTYVWILTNKKAEHRQGKVQLIDASQAFEKLRKNQGFRNCTISPDYAEMIVQSYIAFSNQDATGDCPIASKIFDNDEFRYFSVTIERPLRLRAQFSALKVDELLFDSKDLEFSKYLYQIYGDAVFTGLTDKIAEIKDYLQENDIKKTDKQLEGLISAKKWKERKDLLEAAQKIMHVVGTDVYMDYNIFSDRVSAAAKSEKMKLTAGQLKTICRAMSVTDPEAEPVIKKELKLGAKEYAELTDTFGINEDRLADYGIIAKGNKFVQYEPDSDLRDSEKISVTEDIYEYFQREVRPYVSDAWIELPSTKIGCAITFNKYFYEPASLRSLEENEQDILKLDKESQGFIKSLFSLI